MFRGVFSLTKKKGPRLKHSKCYPNESPLRKLLSCEGKMPLNVRCVTHGIWSHHSTWPEENWRGLKEIWVPMELLARFLGRINLPFMFYFIFFFKPDPLYQTSLNSSISFAFLPEWVQWVSTFFKWFTCKRELKSLYHHHDSSWLHWSANIVLSRG